MGSRLIGQYIDQSVGLVELNFSWSKCEEGKVLAETYVFSWVVFGASLAENDVTRKYRFATKLFNTQAFAITVASVFGSTLSFFMCHDYRSSVELFKVD